jgi:hypothetical protein
MPTEFRRTLGMEGEQVHLRCFKQRIEVTGNEEYQRQLAAASADLLEKARSLEKKGLR